MEVGVRNKSIALILVALTLLGCNRDRKKVIAVIPKATSHLFWVSVQAGALAAGRELGVDVRWNGPATETDFSRQIQIVDSAITQRVDGIVLAAAERKALVAVVERAAAENIPVTIFDSGLDTENYVTFVATNNYEAGKLAARQLAKLLNGKGRIAVVLHVPGSGSTMEREQGFKDVIKAEFPGINIIAEQYGMADRSKSMAATENMLTAHPDLDGLFASTEPSTAGAALAFNQRGAKGKIKFVGFDSSKALIEELEGGTINALVVQDPFKIGFEGVRTVVDKLNGGSPPKRMDLSAKVILKEDLGKPEIKELLFPDVNKYLQ
jgi:ribose transport system substrate-binding protein